MGLEERDWYWRRRPRSNSVDDDHLFPNHHWPARKSVIYPLALVLLVVLALLVFALHQGWFDGDWRSHSARVEAEIAAERAWDGEHPPGVRPPQVRPPREAPQVPTFHEKYRLPIELTLLGLMIISPFVLLGLFIGLFFRRLRQPALIGLLLGVVAAYAGGKLFTSDLWFRWGLLYPADSMGAVFQFFEVIAASFSFAAIAGTVAICVFGKSDSQSSATQVTGETAEVRGNLTNGDQ